MREKYQVSEERMGRNYQLVVSISDMKFSTRPEDALVTYSLGSCLGITAFDPKNGVGGLMHALLPDENASPGRARNNPYMFVDAGLRSMLDRLERHGAVRRNLVIKAAGGADMRGDTIFRTGERNVRRLHEVIAEERLILDGYEVGGTIPRTLFLYMNSGEVVVKTFGKQRSI